MLTQIQLRWRYVTVENAVKRLLHHLTHLANVWRVTPFKANNQLI